MILLILKFLDTNWLITTAINGEVFELIIVIFGAF